MDKSTFEKLIQKEALISQNEAILLEDLLVAFPYCQTAHLLIAKESQQKKSMLFPKKFRKASTYILDRQILHSILTKKNLVSLEIAEEVLTIDVIQETERSKSTLIEDIETTIRQIKESRKQLILNPETDKEEKEPTIPPQEDKIESVELLPKTESRLGDELDKTESKFSVEMFLAYLNSTTESLKKEAPPTENNQIIIIEKFLEKSPKISRAIPHSLIAEASEDLSKNSTELQIELVTENYALILIKQNKFDKAKEVYKKLMLKYPDKSAYFGAKLNEIENK